MLYFLLNMIQLITYILWGVRGCSALLNTTFTLSSSSRDSCFIILSPPPIMDNVILFNFCPWNPHNILLTIHKFLWLFDLFKIISCTDNVRVLKGSNSLSFRFKQVGRIPWISSLIHFRDLTPEGKSSWWPRQYWIGPVENAYSVRCY